jgi:hypothetical protein
MRRRRTFSRSSTREDNAWRLYEIGGADLAARYLEISDPRRQPALPRAAAPAPAPTPAPAPPADPDPFDAIIRTALSWRVPVPAAPAPTPPAEPNPFDALLGGPPFAPSKRPAAPEPTPEGAQMRALFGTLMRSFEQEKPRLDPTRATTLTDVLGRLGGLVERGTTGGRTLDEMLADRESLDGLFREVAAQGRNPSLRGPGAPAASRAGRVLAALQELKMFVVSSGVRNGAAGGLQNATIDLFPRIARLTTWISEAGDDAGKLRRLEADQARGLAAEVRTLARREHVMLAQPVWGRHQAPPDPNRLFFSGPAALRRTLGDVAATLGLELDHPAPAGADFAERRWHDLRAANLAVFDVSDADPQVYYELGMALATGTELLLLAGAETPLPFDVAQNVCRYPSAGDRAPFLRDALDSAMYGLQVRGGKGSSLPATLAYAERLAGGDAANPLARIALRSVRSAKQDATQFVAALKAFNAFLGPREHEILVPRWPGAYPAPLALRAFAVMPFRDEVEAAYAAVAAAAQGAGVEPVRGDVADGQQIIESIWDELCRATHVTVDLTGFNPNVCLELGIAHTLGRPTLLIGREGTERALAAKLPGVAKWRCHAYPAAPRSRSRFLAELERFFTRRPG